MLVFLQELPQEVQLVLSVLLYMICLGILGDTGEARAYFLRRIRLQTLGYWWKQLGRLFLLLLADEEIQGLLITDEVDRIG